MPIIGECRSAHCASAGLLQTLIVVCGPTASGKTSKSIEIAKAIGGEIICADSMQIYKNLPIVTASPTYAEKKEVPHHLFNFVELTENWTVTKYVELAHKKIAEIAANNKIPILVGGTGLYIDSVANNRNFINIDVASDIALNLQNKSNEELFKILLEVDKLSSEKIPMANRRRLIRALEIYYATGRTKTEIDSLSQMSPKYDTIYIGTYFEKSELYNRINERTNIMVKNGLLEEIEKTYNIPLGKTSMQAIGCKELFPYFSGEISLNEAIEKIKQRTRNYAKRQMTWFARNKKIIWVKQKKYY